MILGSPQFRQQVTRVITPPVSSGPIGATAIRGRLINFQENCLSVPVGTLGKLAEFTISYLCRTSSYPAIGCETIDAERCIALRLQVPLDFLPKHHDAKRLAGSI
jgi:hypothetical protein